MWQRIKNVYHLLNAIVANLWFRFPSRHLTVIGVTGTDGKTTTVSIIYHILHEASYNVSMISSVGAVIGEKNYDVGFHVTTPSPWALQRFIKKILHLTARGPAARFPPASAPSSLALLRTKVRAVGSPSTRVTPRFLVLEVTSHALDQHRVWGVKFDIGVLTNVTHEHLDYHKTYENYVLTKMKLLRKSEVSIINKDDTSYKLVKSKVKSQKSKVQGKIKKLVTYGMKDNADVNPKVFPFKTNLIGEFNKYNVLAAASVCRSLGIGDKTIQDAISSFKPPIGREEIVYKNSFTVMIDFAHTPNAFEEILSSIKPNIKGRLIHVFGSAGERDASKRPLMGEVSARYSDVIVLTAEDPRTESVEKIMDEIESGIKNYESRIKNGALLKISNRKEAINTAIKMAKRGDFVLITGKAHEKSMNYGKGEEPWDEFGVVRNALSSRAKRGDPLQKRLLRPVKRARNDNRKLNYV